MGKYKKLYNRSLDEIHAKDIRLAASETKIDMLMQENDRLYNLLQQFAVGKENARAAMEYECAMSDVNKVIDRFCGEIKQNS